VNAGWVEHAEHTLQQAGYRRGGARRAVLELLASQRCSMTARDVEERLRSEGREVGRASVYRALEQLDELRLVQRLEVGQGMARYEPLLPGGDHHHHMVCDRCGRVTPFEDSELEAAIEALARRTRGFQVDEHDVVLHGACARCT
jgi:Fur family transcriptional regulator, ferric uptake regulator